MLHHSLLGDSFIIHRRPNETLLLRAEYESDLLTPGLFDDVRRADGADVPRGRGAVRIIDLSCHPGERMVVRKYRHGGLLRILTRDVFLRPTRALEEARLLLSLESTGACVPMVLGVRITRVLGVFHRMYLVTREIARSRDLREVVLETGPRRGAGFAEWRRMVESVARSLRELHDLGVHHKDLHLKNVLVDSGGAVFFIDFDKSIIEESLPQGIRLKSLARLYRSTTKLERPLTLSRSDLGRFAREYFLANWRRGIRKVAQCYRRSLGIHRLGWWIERFYGGTTAVNGER